MSDSIMNREQCQAFELMTQLEAEVDRSVYMTDQDKQMLVGAVVLGSAVLFEGDPGTGKTTIARTMATAIGGDFHRVQGTPDIQAGDITGSEWFNRKTGEFEFRPGPAFTQVLLADELNRMTPKAQSALLEAMQEKQVTVGNKTYPLGEPFVVLATQNPHERNLGTYPLTVAQLDRFPVSINLPSLEADEMLAIRHLNADPKQVVETKDLSNGRAAIEKQGVSMDLERRAARIVVALRNIDALDPAETVLSGARPFLEIVRHGQALALQDKRASVREQDIDQAADYVLAHRFELKLGKAKNYSKTDVIADAKQEAQTT